MSQSTVVQSAYQPAAVRPKKKKSAEDLRAKILHEIYKLTDDELEVFVGIISALRRGEE